jgi:hypothetical protein
MTSWPRGCAIHADNKKALNIVQGFFIGECQIMMTSFAGLKPSAAVHDLSMRF